MNEHRNTDDETELPLEPAPGDDPDPAPGRSKSPPGNNDPHPDTPSKDVRVTPLDDDENIKQGIEVDET
jgi:hypothetical protein